MTIPPIYTKDYYAARRCIVTYCKKNPQAACDNASLRLKELNKYYEDWCPSSKHVNFLNISQIKGLRNALVSSIDRFINDSGFNKVSAFSIKNYLQMKLLKHSGSNSVEMFLKNDSPFINGQYYHTFLKKIIEGKFITNLDKAKKRENYLNTPFDKLQIYPFRVKTFGKSIIKELFVQIIINGRPHAIFVDSVLAETCHFDLPEHNIIVLAQLHAENKFYLRGKNVLLLNKINNYSGKCQIKAEKYAISLNAKEKNSYSIEALKSYHFSNQRIPLAIDIFHKNIVDALKTGDDGKIVTTIFKIASIILQFTPLQNFATLDQDNLAQMTKEEMNLLDIPENPYLSKPPIPQEMLESFSSPLARPVKKLQKTSTEDKLTSKDAERMQKEIRAMLKEVKKNNDYYSN